MYWFCHTSTCIHHRCTRVPHPEPPSHLPPHTIPLGHPTAPAPSFLYPASNLLGIHTESSLFLFPFLSLFQSSLLLLTFYYLWKYFSSKTYHSWHLCGLLMLPPLEGKLLEDKYHKVETMADFILFGFQNPVDGDSSHKIKTHASWKKSCDKPIHHIKNQRYHFASKGPYTQSYGFSNSHVST